MNTMVSNKTLTAYQILDHMLAKYSISNMLRVTPRKISSFYSVHHIPSTKDKSQGCLIFCPRDEINEGRGKEEGNR